MPIQVLSRHIYVLNARKWIFPGADVDEAVWALIWNVHANLRHYIVFKAVTNHFNTMGVTQQSYDCPSCRKSQATPSPHGPTPGLLAEGAHPLLLCFLLIFHFRPKASFFGFETSKFSNYSTYLQQGNVHRNTINSSH